MNRGNKPEQRDEDGRILIDSWDEMPKDLTEEEEALWWDTHDLSDRMLNEALARDQELRAQGLRPKTPVEQAAEQLAKRRRQA